jgi:zona occludens toxin (predicted ATPase)
MADEVKEPTRRKKILRRLRNILIGSLVLLIILVAAGIIYTWYMGQNTTAYSQDVSASEQDKYTEIKHVVNNDPNQMVGVALGSLSQTVAPGSQASVNVRTTPGADCKISVDYNKDTIKTMNMKVAPMSDPGLINKKADDWGTASWNWTVPADATLGKWYAKVICSRGEKWANAVADLIVKN